MTNFSNAEFRYAGAVSDRIVTVLQEPDAFLMGESKVQHTFERLAKQLAELNVDFALAGGLAVGVRGHFRATVDVDILIAAAGLARFKAERLGRGYVEKFPGSRGLRDALTGVAINFLIAGEFPGDGRPKPVRFPDPSSVPVSESAYRVLDLRTLIELKLAAGMSAPDRLQDLADVIALIRANRLQESFADGLDGSVQPKYRELWVAAQTPGEL